MGACDDPGRSVATPVSESLAVVVVALPFGVAAVLATLGSRRVGVWIHLAAACLLFLLACATRQEPAMLVAFVALTTSWLLTRDGSARVRENLAASQVLLGAILLAMWTRQPIFNWLALLVAVGAAALATGESTSARRILLLCGIGLMVALLGVILLDQTLEFAAALMLFGYGALAGLVPLHAWQIRVATEGNASGAIVSTTLLPTAPLLLLMRLPVRPGLLVGFGLASLLLGAVAVLVHEDVRRRVALAGMAQIGMVVFAIGVGATWVAWLHLVLLSLARPAVLQSRGDDTAAWLALALLPLYALYLLAAPAAAFAVWLLAPLAVGAALLALTLLRHRPAGLHGGWWEVTPIWLQVAVVTILAVMVPAR